MPRTKTKDSRSPEAKARDEWLRSAAGLEILEPSIIKPGLERFLRNRIEVAFMAGVYAGARLEREGR